MRTMAAMFGALLFCASAMATEGQPQGVWKGTLGDQAIVACFNSGSGNYYYLSHLSPIWLQSLDTLYHETADIAWTLDPPHGRAMGGTWRNSKNGVTLPIRLVLVEGDDDPAACARASYAKPLEARPGIVARKPLHYQGHAYRVLDFLGQ